MTDDRHKREVVITEPVPQNLSDRRRQTVAKDDQAGPEHVQAVQGDEQDVRSVAGNAGS